MDEKNMKDVELIGKKFGRLTIVNFYYKWEKDRWNRCYVIAICDCGNKTTLVKDSLTRKKPTRSCGCLRNEMISKRSSKEGIIAAKNNLYYKYRTSAKKRSLEFNLTLEQFYNLVISPCHYCKIKPNKSTKKTSKSIINWFLYTGIDRKDNDKGYTLENSVPCCSQCNFSKHVQTYEQFIEYLKRIGTIWSK